MKIFGKILDATILETIRTEAALAVFRSAMARRICETLGMEGRGTGSPRRGPPAGQRPSSGSLLGDRYGGSLEALPSDEAGTGDPRRAEAGLFRRGGMESLVHGQLPQQKTRTSGNTSHPSGGDPDGGQEGGLPGRQRGRRAGNRSAVEGASVDRECRQNFGKFWKR